MRVVRDFAIEAEGAGFDSLWVQEHLFRPEHPKTGYGGIPDAPWPEQHNNVLSPLEVLAFVAAHTQRCTVGTSILVAGYHHPLDLAKRAATLDVLSGGRFVLGVGGGWSEDEYAVLGKPFRSRGALTDEVLEALNECWGPGLVDHAGEFFTIPSSRTSPTPANGTRVRTYGGFVARAGWRRVARWCDAWQPYGLPPEKAREGLEEINHIAHSEFGRPSLELSLRATISPHFSGEEVDGRIGQWTGPVDTLAERVAAARVAGCDEVVVDTNFAPGAHEAGYWEKLPTLLSPLIEAAHG